MAVATAFGVVAGVVQFLGLVRWPFLVPYLADAYLDPASSLATRESVAVVFGAFNQYAGVGVGENLGYLFTGMDAAGRPGHVRVAVAVQKVAWPPGCGVGSRHCRRHVRAAGFEPAAEIVVVGYILWSVWLALTGIFLLLPRSLRTDPPRS